MCRLLPKCLPPTCPSKDVYLLTVYCWSVCLPPICPPKWVYCWGIYRRPVHLNVSTADVSTADLSIKPCILSNHQLPTCLRPTCPPTYYVYCWFVYSRPVHLRPVYYSHSLSVYCQTVHQRPFWHTPVYCLPVYLHMSSASLSTSDLSTADLSTTVHRYAPHLNSDIYLRLTCVSGLSTLPSVFHTCCLSRQLMMQSCIGIFNCAVISFMAY